MRFIIFLRRGERIIASFTKYWFIYSFWCVFKCLIPLPSPLSLPSAPPPLLLPSSSPPLLPSYSLAGVGSVSRSYVAESTDTKERIGAMAAIGSCQALGFVLGPGQSEFKKCLNKLCCLGKWLGYYVIMQISLKW